MASCLDRIEGWCTLDNCDERLGRTPARPRIRIGTRLGIQDEPLNAFLRLGRYETLAAAHVEWVQCPNDLHAVSAMLTAGLVDVALLPAEDAVLQVFTRAKLRVCGMLSGNPRRWGLAQRKGNSHKGARRIILPEGTGGHLAAAEMSDVTTSSGSQSPRFDMKRTEFLEQESFVEALSTLAATSSVDAVLWEMTVFEEVALAAVREVDIVKEVTLPWPSHLFIATQETVHAKLVTVKRFLRFSSLLAKHLKAGGDNAPMDYFKKTYELPPDVLDKWFRASSWDFSYDVDARALMGPLVRLHKMRWLPSAHHSMLPHRLAPGIRVFAQKPSALGEGNSTKQEVSYNGNDSVEEGPKLPLSGARSHHFLPRLSESLLCPEQPRKFWMKDRTLLPARAPPESLELPCDAPGDSDTDAEVSLSNCMMQEDSDGPFEPVPAG